MRFNPPAQVLQPCSCYCAAATTSTATIGAAFACAQLLGEHRADGGVAEEGREEGGEPGHLQL